jgi:hypothetical protein
VLDAANEVSPPGVDEEVANVDACPPAPITTALGPGFTVKPVAVLYPPAPPPPAAPEPAPPPPTTRYSTDNGPLFTSKSPEFVKV